MTGPNLTGIFGRQASGALPLIHNITAYVSAAVAQRHTAAAAPRLEIAETSFAHPASLGLQSGQAAGYDYSRANKESGESAPCRPLFPCPARGLMLFFFQASPGARTP